MSGKIEKTGVGLWLFRIIPGVLGGLCLLVLLLWSFSPFWTAWMIGKMMEEKAGVEEYLEAIRGSPQQGRGEAFLRETGEGERFAVTVGSADEVYLWERRGPLNNWVLLVVEGESGQVSAAEVVVGDFWRRAHYSRGPRGDGAN